MGINVSYEELLYIVTVKLERLIIPSVGEMVGGKTEQQNKLD